MVDAETVAEVTIVDEAQRPVKRSAVRVEAFMMHPGMAPVLETAPATRDGVYALRVRFTMPGEWVLSVKDEQGARVQGSEFKVVVRGPSP
jgi:hypothetical protein